LRRMPGVESVAVAGWPLLTSNWNSFISINGAPPSQVLTDFLNVSPGWFDVMRIPILGGRDFRSGESYPGIAIVNQAFARQYFNGENPVGKSFDKTDDEGPRSRFQIVGLVTDARYRSIREPVPPVAYVPFSSSGSAEGTFLVRTAGANPLTLAAALRRQVTRARSEFRVSNLRTQQEINDAQTVRERLLAMLAVFFALVALLLAAIGIYGVLDYSVFQRRREIGIRMAIGALPGDVARQVTADVFCMVLAGGIGGCLLGLASLRYVESLLYRVEGTNLPMLLLPALAIGTATLLAALPPVLRAVHTNPVALLRAE
jgi:predicted permease